MILPKLHYPAPGAAGWTGPMNENVRFSMEHQLMNEKTWSDFVRLFREDSDDCDKGWRGEYWGKMMRGACLVYRYNGDPALYRVLETTVRDMLTAQRTDGRFSTYSETCQLQGWDVWGRKYILTSLLHFCDICRDEALKFEILKAACAHTDAMIALVGDGDGKIPITKTSNFWGGVNSASILDAVIDLYRHTNIESYRAFAQYIISTGGCAEGNLIELALENRLKPYQYPVVKAYETMSFFEGVLSWYELTGENKYLRAVLNFTEAVQDTDMTVIGCSGCTHELFDNSSVRQAIYSDGIMQETCVTVTWMRLMAKLFLLTGEEKYAARMEISAWNALYGSLNTGNLAQYSAKAKGWVDALPFDSYAPLYNSSRGRAVGGFKHFAFGGYYGCCACIASAGIALLPLCAAVYGEEEICFAFFPGGILTGKTPEGNDLIIRMDSAYPVHVLWTASFTLDQPEAFAVKVRIPEYIREAYTLCVNGEEWEATCESGFVSVCRQWKTGDTLVLNGSTDLRAHHLNGRTAYTYGPLVLCRDAAKESGRDLTETLSQPSDSLSCQWVQPEAGELLRFMLTTEDGKQIPLTDYASCGKNWLGQHNRISVWMNIRERSIP